MLLVGLTLLFTFDLLLESVLLLQGADYHIAIPTIVSCLPIVALFFVLLEVVTAYGLRLRRCALSYCLSANAVAAEYDGLVFTLGNVWFHCLSLLRCVLVDCNRSDVDDRAQDYATPSARRRSCIREIKLAQGIDSLAPL